MPENNDQAMWSAAQWHGKMLVDQDGDKIGKLQDVPPGPSLSQSELARWLAHWPSGLPLSTALLLRPPFLVRPPRRPRRATGASECLSQNAGLKSP